jgi:hypothetical protein
MSDSFMVAEWSRIEDNGSGGYPNRIDFRGEVRR